MLPPSSPQQHNSGNSYAGQLSRATPHPPTFPSLRDLPGLSSHRPGSSMSISSIIGTDSGHPTQQSHPSTTAPSPSLKSMQPPSPQRTTPVGTRMEFGQYKRPQTPEKQESRSASRPTDSHAGSAASPERPLVGTQKSPEQGRRVVSLGQQAHGTSTSQGFRPYQAAPGKAPTNGPSRQDGTEAPPRPSSQPVDLSTPGRRSETKDRYGTTFFGSRFFGASQEENRRDEQPQPQQEQQQHPFDRLAERERATTVQPTSHSIYSPPRSLGPIFGQPDGPQMMQRHSLSHPLREDQAGLFRPAYQQSSTSGQVLNPNGIGSRGDVGRSTTAIQHAQRASEQYSLPPSSNFNTDRNGVDANGHPQALNTTELQSRMSGQDQQLRRPVDEPQTQQRAFLGISPELNRRSGRNSPLPQAVQGAQARFSGPGGDPSIKSEFGRMFSGLGSGVGSNTPNASYSGNGTSTPSRLSPPRPVDGLEGTPTRGVVDSDILKIARAGSRGGRKPRRVINEDGKPDSESGDGGDTPIGGGPRNNKRAKINHPIITITIIGRTKSLPQCSLLSRTPPALLRSIPSSSTRMQPKLRARAEVTITTIIMHYTLHVITTIPQSLQRRSANLRRQYPLTSLDAKHLYASHPKLIPRFDGKENCTLTVRVPRYFLSVDQREQICVARNIWGTDIHTDDTDPIAAAIHGGWIRGEWAEDVDTEMLDLGPTHDSEIEVDHTAVDSLQPLNAAPSVEPMTPPPDMDLHITLLVLPALEAYASSVLHGLKSRAWGGNHDGMSFKILRLEWVDEGLTRAQERNAEARRKRLRAAMNLLSLGAKDAAAGVYERHKKKAMRKVVSATA
ncbi:hypothetical protein B0A49_09707 [Cryomyces minteri]|uniref:Rxt3-domain-containing protein n=1 Tax=Cryomyces minteri TaxID=331657 RepID=A0A4U0WCC5_9PEZI|nr:hypothetical protein B0A49_09707 [Cryomyces minteri]